MDWLLRLQLTTRKRCPYAASEHSGPGFDPGRRIYGRGDDCGLKAFPEKVRYPRKIIDGGKWEIQMAESKNAMR